MVYAVAAILAGMVLPRIETLFFPHLKAELSIDVAIDLLDGAVQRNRILAAPGDVDRP
jgi:hypothetical protein